MKEMISPMLKRSLKQSLSIECPMIVALPLRLITMETSLRMMEKLLRMSSASARVYRGFLGMGLIKSWPTKIAKLRVLISSTYSSRWDLSSLSLSSSKGSLNKTLDPKSEVASTRMEGRRLMKSSSSLSS